MAKEDNLKPFDSNQSREKAKINGRKGGIASGEAKRKKKTMKEMLDYLLEKEIKNNQGETATTLEAISVSIIKQAMSGNVRAFEIIRDTIGQNPTQKLNLENLGFNVTVADEKHKKMLEEL